MEGAVRFSYIIEAGYLQDWVVLAAGLRGWRVL